MIVMMILLLPLMAMMHACMQVVLPVSVSPSVVDSNSSEKQPLLRNGSSNAGVGDMEAGKPLRA